MLILREDTVVTVQIGPFVDATDGATAEIALTIDQGDVHLSKNGGAFGNKNEATACTHDAEHNGWYTCPLDATDTNTAGVLILAVNEAGALPVWHEFMVMPTQVWDSLFSTDVLQVHAIEITNGLITAAAIADAAIDAATFAAGAINAAAIAADAIGASELAADAATEIAAAVWNSLVASYTTNVTFGKYLGGAPAGATLAADVVDIHTDVGTVHTDVDAILADTNELQTDWVNAGRLDAILDLILADTAELQTDWVNGGRLDLLLDAVTPGITAAVVADAVWDELSTGHVTAGKAGTQLWTDIDAILAGPGGIKFVYTLTDSVTANPIADCLIWVTTDTAGTSRVTSARTDALGQVTFYLDAGTYYIWRQKSGYAFVNPDTEVVA